MNANAFDVQMKGCAYETINGQVLDIVQYSGMILGVEPLAEEMVAGMLICLFSSCFFRV